MLGRSFWWALTCFVILVGLAFSPAKADAPVKLRASLDTSATHQRTVSIADYLEKLGRASGGSIQTELFHSGQLYKDVNVTKALREGGIEMAAPGIWVLSGFVPDTDIVQLPIFYGQPLEKQLRIIDGQLGQAISAEIEKRLGVKVLGPWLNLGFANYYSTRKPLDDFKDLSDMKIRTSGGAGQFARAKFFGAIPNMTPWPDVPLGLSQGTFDALSTTNESMVSAKLWDSGVRYAFEDHQFLGFYVPMVSATFWKKLTPEQQRLITDTWAQNIPIYRRNMEEAQQAARGVLAEHGIKFVDPSPEQIAAVRRKMMADQDAIARDLKLTPELVKLATAEMAKTN